MELIIDNSWTEVVFTEEEEQSGLKEFIEKELHRGIGVKYDYIHNFAYKMGHWDGITDYYDKVEQRFPTGLADDVDKVLGEAQNKYNFTYSFFDNRPDAFIDPKEVPEEVNLLDNEIGEITLRDYQQPAVRKTFENRSLVVHVGTGGGKCLTPDTLLSTDKGLMTLENFFKLAGETLEGEESVVPYQGTIQLINRFGEKESPIALTKNGKRGILKITTGKGLFIKVTKNHPLLVLNKDEQEEWKLAKDIELRDKVVIRKGTDTYGEYTFFEPDEWYKLGEDLKEESDVSKEITADILMSPREHQVYFLKGLLDDNCQVTGNEDFLNNINTMLLNIGIEGYIKTEEPNVYSWNVSDKHKTLLHKLLNDPEYNVKQYIRLEDTQEVESIKEFEGVDTFDVSMPDTHSFIANGIVNHNTEIASGIIKQMYDELEPGETIAFFTQSSSIFNQTIERLKERLNVPIGWFKSGKKNIQKVNVVMTPTIYASLKIDPEKGLKLNAKERVVKKMAKDITPQYTKGVNQKMLLKSYIRNFQVKTKADEDFLDEIQKVIDNSESDAKAKFNLNGYTVEYEKMLKKKNEKKFKKKKEITDFLDTIVGFVSDEHHHITGDTLYETLLACNNAIYRVGLTGSIEKENLILTQRMKAVTGNKVHRISTKFLVENGFLAEPTITLTPIYQVTNEGKQIDVREIADYREAYEAAIMRNEYRNELIAKISEMCYNKGEGVLIVVNRIEHGELLSDMLEELKVPHKFLQGEVDDDTREEQIGYMRTGELKVMIATTILDEGVDINGIDALILAAGGKSLRQTIQRVGRAIRKKKTGENVADVYDFYDRTHKFMFNHAKEREKIYKEEEFKIKRIE